MFKKIVIIMILLFSSFFMINTTSVVFAEDIFGNEESTEKFDYSSEDYDDGEEYDDEEDFSVDFEKDDGLGKQSKPKKSYGIIFAEIFCGVIGLFMVFLAFRAIDS